MANEEQKASGLIGACSHNASPVATCLAANFGEQFNLMKIQGQGVKGYTVNQSVNEQLAGALTYVGGGLIAKGVKGTTVVHFLLADGTSIGNVTATGMVAGERSWSIEHGTGNHSAFVQSLRYEGDMATDPLTVTYP